MVIMWHQPPSPFEMEIITMRDIKKFIEETINDTSLLKSDEIPNIDLYMDQVTTFLTSHLANESEDEEPVFTKTMINNYAKCQLLPAPEKKKYTKDHMLMLINIYYLKNIMSINNIHKLLNPLAKDFFHVEDGVDLSDVYDEVFTSLENIKKETNKDMLDKLKLSSALFKDLDVNDKDYLQLYSFISMLSFDIYMKKQLIESLIDTLDTPSKEKDKDKE